MVLKLQLKSILVPGLAPQRELHALEQHADSERAEFTASLGQSCCRWMVPALWGPAVLVCLAQALSKQEQHWVVCLLFVGIGVLLWQLLEYCIHRYSVQTSERTLLLLCAVHYVANASLLYC